MCRPSTLSRMNKGFESRMNKNSEPRTGTTPMCSQSFSHHFSPKFPLLVCPQGFGFWEAEPPLFSAFSLVFTRFYLFAGRGSFNSAVNSSFRLSPFQPKDLTPELILSALPVLLQILFAPPPPPHKKKKKPPNPSRFLPPAALPPHLLRLARRTAATVAVSARAAAATFKA